MDNLKLKGRMKLTHILMAGVLSAALIVARAADTPKVGDKAPSFEAKDQDGKTVKLSDFTGKQTVLLYFYPKDQTPGCTKERSEEHTSELQSRFGISYAVFCLK